MIYIIHVSFALLYFTTLNFFWFWTLCWRFVVHEWLYKRSSHQLVSLIYQHYLWAYAEYSFDFMWLLCWFYEHWHTIIFQNPIHCIVTCCLLNKGVIWVTPYIVLLLQQQRPLLEASMHTYCHAICRAYSFRNHLDNRVHHPTVQVLSDLLFLFSTCLGTVVWRTYSVIRCTTSFPLSSPRSWKVSNPQSQPAVSRCLIFLINFFFLTDQLGLTIFVTGPSPSLQVTSIPMWRRSSCGTVNSWGRTHPLSSSTVCSFSAASTLASPRWSSTASCPSPTSWTATKPTRITPRPLSCASADQYQ